MKKKLRRTFATLSCAIVGVTALGLASACSFSDSSQACEHIWNEGEIKTAATCTTDGEMLLTCTKCQETKTESIPMGHNYVNGACSACGNIDPSGKTVDNFYFNLIESLATAETYYVEIPEFAITLTDERKERYIACEDLKFMLGVDENGFLCGKGMLQGVLTDTFKGSVANDVNLEVSCQVLLENGYIYLKTSSDDGNEILFFDQACLLERVAVYPEASVAIDLMETVLAVDECGELINSIKDVKNNPLNTVMEAIFEYVYTKQATDDGYAFTLNANRLMDVYEVIAEQTVGGVFNTVFGANAYTNFVDYLVASVDKTIGEFASEVELKCEEIGATPETVYSLVNTVANAILGEEAGGEFDISAMLETYEETPLVEIFNAILGEEHSAEKYKERLRREATNLYSVKVLDTLSAEQKYEIEEMLSQIVEEFEKSTIQFYTDKEGNLLSVNYDLKEFGNADTMIEGYKMNFVPDGSFTGDFEDFATALKGHVKVLEFERSMIVEDFDHLINGQPLNYHLIVDETDDDVYLWDYDTSHPNGDVIEVLGEETYNGKLCTKLSVVSQNFYELSLTMVTVREKDDGWNEYSITWNMLQNAQFTAWITEDGVIVGLELVEYDQDDGYEYFANFSVVYNPETGAYGANP